MRERAAYIWITHILWFGKRAQKIEICMHSRAWVGRAVHRYCATAQLAACFAAAASSLLPLCLFDNNQPPSHSLAVLLLKHEPCTTEIHMHILYAHLFIREVINARGVWRLHAPSALGGAAEGRRGETAAARAPRARAARAQPTEISNQTMHD